MIDAMSLAEVSEIFAYWQHNPPPHLLLQAIARLLGWAPPPGATGGSPSLAELAAAPPPGLTVIRGADPALPPPLAEAALREKNRARAVAIARRNPAD